MASLAHPPIKHHWAHRQEGSLALGAEKSQAFSEPHPGILNWHLPYLPNSTVPMPTLLTTQIFVRCLLVKEGEERGKKEFIPVLMNQPEFTMSPNEGKYGNHPMLADPVRYRWIWYWQGSMGSKVPCKEGRKLGQSSALLVTTTSQPLSTHNSNISFRAIHTAFPTP